ncbi:unnamed protein product [Paramecium pentaurelia]|uniref:14-3-3 domain-containing protein n=1 Tax=Paramecium pentaurelia TaxID=43138 RepID=A0A8S1WAE2_9CILI|nr:unnamed protein product [Paramecium pentaurelia]
MSDKRDEYTYMARLAEQTERWEDMVENMKKVAEITKDLNNEERNLLSIAYKNTVGQRRTAWRAITAYEIKEKQKIVKYQEVLQYYKARVEKELDYYCNEVLQLIDHTLLKKTTNTEARVFYHKMKGDYNRYISEYSQQKAQEKAIQQAQQAYQTALELIDKDKFPKTNLLRLGVTLNYSVFCYEIMSDVAKACELAKTVKDEAIKELDDMEEDQYKDVTTILQLINDNLTNWQAELPDEGGKK